jgi:hypothetical protein
LESGKCDVFNGAGDEMVLDIGAQRYCAKYADLVDCFDVEDSTSVRNHNDLIMKDIYIEVILEMIEQ